jgi:hypothetical protein
VVGVADALIAFDRERFDVVLSDIEMADGDGYALCSTRGSRSVVDFGPLSSPEGPLYTRAYSHILPVTGGF